MPNLSPRSTSAVSNLLPYGGAADDYGTVIPQPEADAYFSLLLKDIAWKHDEVSIYGKRIVTARQTAWYGAQPFAYTYSGITRRALPWHPLLLEIKHTVECLIRPNSPAVFNSCLLNLYSDGREGMAWHSDDEPELGKRPVIASVSFGAVRKFAFKHKTTREKREILLQHGQLIVMHGETQAQWQHAVMKSLKIHQPRISLTFRTILDSPASAN